MKSNHKPKAIIWDVDETLIDSTSWLYLIAGLNADRQVHMELYRKYLAGSLSYDQVRPLIMENLARQVTGNITRTTIREICQGVIISPQALSLMPKLHQDGMQMCLISAGIDLFIEDLAARLGIDHWYANSKLVFDEREIIVDFHFTQAMDALKVEHLDDFLDVTNLRYVDCIAIGDGETDKELFKRVRGVAYKSDDEHLNSLAWKCISDLSEIEGIVGIT